MSDEKDIGLEMATKWGSSYPPGPERDAAVGGYRLGFRVGQTVLLEQQAAAKPNAKFLKCSQCQGSGRMVYSLRSCSKCNGRGGEFDPEPYWSKQLRGKAPTIVIYDDDDPIEKKEDKK